MNLDIKGINSPVVILASVVLIVFSVLAWNYTEAIKEKNEVDRYQIKTNADIKFQELQQEKEIKQNALNRELELDCQKRITAMKKEFYNLQNGYFDIETRLCMVSYKDTKTKELEWSDIDLMRAN